MYVGTNGSINNLSHIQIAQKNLDYFEVLSLIIFEEESRIW